MSRIASAIAYEEEDEDEDVARLGDGLITLQFDRRTGRRLSLTDESDSATVLHRGDLLSSLLLSVDGVTTATRHINQLFAVADTETIDLYWQLEPVEFRREAESGQLVTRFREGNWSVELRDDLRP